MEHFIFNELFHNHNHTLCQLLLDFILSHTHTYTRSHTQPFTQVGFFSIILRLGLEQSWSSTIGMSDPQNSNGAPMKIVIQWQYCNKGNPFVTGTGVFTISTTQFKYGAKSRKKSVISKNKLC